MLLNCFPSWLYHLIFPPATCESSYFPLLATLIDTRPIFLSVCLYEIVNFYFPTSGSEFLFMFLLTSDFFVWESPVCVLCLYFCWIICLSYWFVITYMAWKVILSFSQYVLSFRFMCCHIEALSVKVLFVLSVTYYDQIPLSSKPCCFLYLGV